MAFRGLGPFGKAVVVGTGGLAVGALFKLEIIPNVRRTTRRMLTENLYKQFVE